MPVADALKFVGMSTSPFDRRTEPNGTLERGGHGVEFYAYDAQIIDKVARFIGPALEGGDEVAVVIATPQHRSGLDGALASRGIDVRGATREGRYLPLDAATTLSKFIVDGKPDPERFVEVIGGSIAKALADGRYAHVRAYGEMVALLWLAGRPQAAIALEKMWNELGRSRSFTLLCGYPIAAFQPSQAAQIAELGRRHTQVGPFQALPGGVPA